MMRCTLVAMVPVAARRRKRALGGVRPTAGARVGFRESSARRSTCRRCRSREIKVAPSRRARSSGARGSRGASFARHRSCTRRKRSGRLVTSYGHSVRARVCKNFADPKRPKRESSTRFSETFLFHSLARARTRDTKTPRPPRFVSRAPWEVHGTPADVSAAEASARYVPARFARLAVGTHVRRRRRLDFSRARVASRHPRLTPFPHSARFPASFTTGSRAQGFPPRRARRRQRRAIHPAGLRPPRRGYQPRRLEAAGSALGDGTQRPG